MGNLFSGLDKLGLSLEGMQVFEEEKKETKEKEKKPEVTEADLLLDRTYKCPVCDSSFKSKAVKSGKAKLIETEMDLRPRFQNVDSLKYDAIVCPNCGYSALSRFFDHITLPQEKLVREKISSNFQGLEEDKDIYTYDDAIERHKLALVNAIVKKGRASEKAYICLKMAWLYRGKAENLDAESPNYEEELNSCQTEEQECLKNAFEGFQQGMASEAFPMCGMDETTVDYLVAVLALRNDKLEIASKLISNIILSRTANKRMKEKAHDLKDEILAKMHEAK